MFGSHGRVLLLRSAALGALRRDLITALGTERARGFLLRYGWSLGREDAITLRAEQPGLSDREWLEAGPRLHTEARMVRAQTDEVLIDRERGLFRIQGTWEESYEAQEHLRHCGVAAGPACWTLVGYAGGYCTAVFGERVLFREVACVAKGDPVCRYVGLPEREWGVRIQSDLPLYEEELLAEELETANQRIRRQNEQLSQVVAVNDELSRVLLGGQGLQALAEVMGNMLGCAVAVEDRQLRLLAIGGAGGRREATLGELAQRSPIIRSWLARVEQEKLTVVLPAGVGADPAGSRVVAPVLVGDELLGFVTISLAEGLIPLLSRIMAERFALTCGLELLKERTALAVEQRLRGEFADNLLTAGGDADFLNRWARHLGVALTEADHRFFLVKPAQEYEAAGDAPIPAGQERLASLVREGLGGDWPGAFLVHRGGALVVLLPCRPGDREELSPAGVAARIQRTAERTGTPVWVGISRPFRGAGAAPAAYEECRTLLGAMREARVGGPIIQVDRLGATQLLGGMLAGPAAARFARDLLGPLLAYDEVHQSDLVPTLRLYLQLEGNLQQTARQLSISVSGLKYRLQRVREVGALDLDDPETRFDLMVALRLLLLQDRAGSGGGNSPNLHYP